MGTGETPPSLSSGESVFFLRLLENVRVNKCFSRVKPNYYAY
jgi:hypothetical protein